MSGAMQQGSMWRKATPARAAGLPGAASCRAVRRWPSSCRQAGRRGNGGVGEVSGCQVKSQRRRGCRLHMQQAFS